MKMKRYFLIIVLFFPFVSRAQYATNETGLWDYMWRSAGNAGFSPGGTYGTDLAIAPSGIPYVAFEDETANNKISVMCMVDKQWVYPGPPLISESGVMFPSIAISPAGEPYVAFEDFHKYSMATVMKLSGQEWVTVGEPGISVGEAGYTSIAFDYAGVPYVGFSDNGLQSKESVMKFDGSTWVNVGLPGFSEGGSWYNCIAINSAGVPYVAYVDYEHNNKISVMKFDGSNWVYVGPPGFTPGYPDEISLAISPTGQPWVAYADGEQGEVPDVMKYDETTGWTRVGQYPFSNSVWNTSLTFGPDGMPYLALAKFKTPIGPYKASVMKFDGANWVYVGQEGFSDDGISNPSLAFGTDGNPYVAYVDYGNNLKATVMVYDNEYQAINEPGGKCVRLYPNPAASELTIELKTSEGKELCYEITDTKGLTLTKGRTSENRITLDVHNYPAGIYFYRIKGAKTTFAGKFCKD
jgi:hypothetical protein